MTRVFLVSVLLLCALSPLPGLAQESSPPPLISAPDAPPAPSQDAPVAEESPEKPKGEIIPRDWKPEGTVHKTGRIVLESLAGLLLGGLGVIPGAALILDTVTCEGCESSGQFLAGTALGLVGVSMGSVLGVWLVGSLMGAEGQFLGTLRGAGIAALVGILATAAFSGSGALLIPLITLPLVGAVIGYESSHGEELERRAAEAGRVTVLPTLGVSPSGGVVAGLVGRF